MKIKVQTFTTDENSDTELAKIINNIVKEGRLISLEQTDGYEWRVIFEVED